MKILRAFIQNSSAIRCVTCIKTNADRELEQWTRDLSETQFKLWTFLSDYDLKQAYEQGPDVDGLQIL